jgi:GntR family transcriptional regulator
MIAADLETKIKDGEYRPGQALPGQRELSAAYGVTLMTLRQALALLTDRGLVAQHPGRGTFVTSPKAAYSMGSLRSLSDDLRAQGHAVDTVVLARDTATLPGWAAERLGLPAGVHALRIERLRRLGATPAIHQVSWVPEPGAGSLAGADLAAVPLYDALIAGGTAVVSAEERLSPALLGEELSVLLDRPAGAPVFRSDRTTFGAGGTPVLVDRATILGELVEIRTHRARASVSLEWTSGGTPHSAG